jgi:hypothetical protein
VGAAEDNRNSDDRREALHVAAEVLSGKGRLCSHLSFQTLAELMGDPRPTAFPVGASRSVCSRRWKERLD